MTILQYVLFGIREVPQASTGFTLFKLLFDDQPKGLLDEAREAWEQQPAPQRTVIKHVLGVIEASRNPWSSPLVMVPKQDSATISESLTRCLPSFWMNFDGLDSQPTQRNASLA